jgi:hypothetical protein
MKLFEVSNPDFGKAFKKISSALRTHSPDGVEWVDSIESADYSIVHVVGGQEYEKLLTMDLNKTIIYQHCFLTSGVEENLWKPLWKDSALLVSWNNLGSYLLEGTNFLRIPLGADPLVYAKVPEINKNIDIFTTGHVAKTESIDKIYEACKQAGKVLNHTGENFRYSPNWYKYVNYIDENLYGSFLSRAKYVAGLREIEGFEMHCIESAMTGSVPIVPNLPSYDFYSDFAKVIDLDGDVVSQLVEILNSPYKTLSNETVDYIRHEFSWEKIISRIFSEIDK